MSYPARAKGLVNMIKLQQPYLDDCDKTRTLEFVAEIQAMIDNDPSKSIRSIARSMGVSEFILRQVVHEDIWHFLDKMRKNWFSSQAMKDNRKDFTAKLWANSSDLNGFCFFSDDKDFAWIWWWTRRTIVGLLCPNDMY